MKKSKENPPLSYSVYSGGTVFTISHRFRFPPEGIRNIMQDTKQGRKIKALIGYQPIQAPRETNVKQNKPQSLWKQVPHTSQPGAAWSPVCCPLSAFQPRFPCCHPSFPFSWTSPMTSAWHCLIVPASSSCHLTMSRAAASRTPPHHLRGCSRPQSSLDSNHQRGVLRGLLL